MVLNSLAPWPADALAYHFAAGNAFFAGVALLCAGLALRAAERGPKTRWAAYIAGAAGAGTIAFAATPFPHLVHTAWLVLVVTAWALRGEVEKAGSYALGAACVVSLLLAAWELPHHRAPELEGPRHDVLYVIGDSLSMGAREPGGNWPALLGDKLGIEARNFSHGGATLASSLPNARRIEHAEAYVIIAVGGSDILEGGLTSFEPDLRALLEIVQQEGRTVLMLELPLPPFHNAAGRAQRRLASEYGVTLIPKRSLARVLFTPGATVDGLHLASEGHQLLARELAAILKDANG